ncbi:MAG: hypothetical protein Q7S76_03535 [bacterium]|nr:hypothetical protein [bacterium]
MQNREAEMDRIPDPDDRLTPLRSLIFSGYLDKSSLHRPVTLAHGGFSSINDEMVLYAEYHPDGPGDPRNIQVGDTLVCDIDTRPATWYPAGTPIDRVAKPWGAGFSGVVTDIVAGEFGLNDAEDCQALESGRPRGLGYVVRVTPTR